MFIAATNNPDAMDQAALRGVGFAEKIFMDRLQGADLQEFLEKEFAYRSAVSFDADLTPASLAAKLEVAAPSDAIALLRMAINNTFDQGGEIRAVCLEDIERALRSQSFS